MKRTCLFQRSVLWCIPFTVLCFVALAGCGSPAETTAPDASLEQTAQGHAADAEHGPHDGCLVALDVDGYQAEWVHDDETGKLTFFILDTSTNEAAALEAEQLRIDLKAGEHAKQYTVTAVDDAQTPAGNTQFEVVDLALLESLKVGSGVDAVLYVPIEGREATGRLEYHDHDEHGHHHH